MFRPSPGHPQALKENRSKITSGSGTTKFVTAFISDCHLSLS